MKKKKSFKIKVLTQKRTVRQYPKFILTGIIGVIVNLSILYTLTELFNVYYLISAIIAAVISATCNFMINKTWTFKEDIGERFWQKYLKFGIVWFTVILISLGILYLLTEYLHLYYLVSQFIALTVVGFISFLAHKIWVFEKYRLGKK